MKGGINFEEWKEIVKKNRRSLRSKSNIFRFEPESLTYGAEKAVKSPEYGQVHTITYNVTGDVDTTNWPTEIKSGKTLTLLLTLPYGASNTITANAAHTYENDTLTIPNIQANLSITIEVGVPSYENAKVGDYLYDDWTFGPTAKTGWIARCVAIEGTEGNKKTVWCYNETNSGLKWSTETVNTGLTDYSTSTAAKADMSGKENTALLVSLGADKYEAAAWASLQFEGLGYLPSVGELDKYFDKMRSYGLASSYSYYWTSTEIDYYYAYVRTNNGYFTNKGKNSTSYYSTSGTFYVIALCQLSGPCGKPVNNNGHEYVDLGLPSGTLWATMNVGASSETDYGNYYMYGMGSKTYDSTDTPYDGTEDPLDLTKDTARQVWGGDWHMPTRAQMQELTANTTYQWVENYQGSGINGGLLTATNGAVLFIPAAGYWNNGSQYDVGNNGYCWGSSPDGSNLAYGSDFGHGYEDVGNYNRKCGWSVRPVIG